MNKNISPAPSSVLVRGSKGFVEVLILIILALIVIGGIGYYAYKNGQMKLPNQTAPTNLTSAPDPTANWETYTSTQFNFSIKHPTSWTEKGPIVNNSNEIVYFLSDSSYGTTKELSPGVFLSHQKDIPKLNYQETTLNDSKVYKTTEWPGRFGMLSYFIENESSEYITVSLTPYDEKSPFKGQELYKQTFDQILSTFKFLDSDLLDVSKWKKYELNKLGFWVKYPSSWEIARVTEYDVIIASTQDVLFSDAITPPKDHTAIRFSFTEAALENYTDGESEKTFPNGTLVKFGRTYRNPGSFGIETYYWKEDPQIENYEEIYKLMLENYFYVGLYGD